LDVSWETQGTFEPRDYCVQYRESDFDFASRLMEEEGIFYFFEHDEKKHKMVLGNDPSVHKPAAGSRSEHLPGGLRQERA
jgi:type VI secretion system secreted protein VgrG